MNCLQCSTEIAVTRKFCSSSCAASYNNTHAPKRKLVNTCRKCSALIISNRSFCKACIAKKAHVNGIPITCNRTIKSMLQKGSRANRYSYIRANARTVATSLPDICSKCGYSNHVEVCHLKDISSFSLSATLGEVNHISNLVKLCPNHHWEFDNDLLSL